MSGSHDGLADWKQMEAAHHAQSSRADGISQKVLTEALRSMVDDGIVIRKAYPEVPPRVEYSLTELGESMRPIIKAMENWGTAYKEQMN